MNKIDNTFGSKLGKFASNFSLQFHFQLRKRKIIG